jgi:hypothetical protein
LAHSRARLAALGAVLAIAGAALAGCGVGNPGSAIVVDGKATSEKAIEQGVVELAEHVLGPDQLTANHMLAFLAFDGAFAKVLDQAGVAMPSEEDVVELLAEVRSQAQASAVETGLEPPTETDHYSDSVLAVGRFVYLAQSPESPLNAAPELYDEAMALVEDPTFAIVSPRFGTLNLAIEAGVDPPSFPWLVSSEEPLADLGVDELTLQ